MVLSININELERKLQCAICLDMICNPKSLNCNHSYCKRCLDKILKFGYNGSASIKCPKGCVPETQISSNQTTNDLRIDYTMKDILDTTNWKGKYAGKLRCISCTRDIKRYCAQCKDFKCEHCPDEHSNTENWFVPVAFLPGKNHPGKVFIVCNKHSTEAKYVCCGNQFICMYCLERDHNKSQYAHSNYETLDKVETTLKSTLNEKISSNSDYDKRRAEAGKEILDVKHKLHNTLQINKLKCIRDYIDHLDKEEEKIKDELDVLCTKYTDTLDAIPYFQECVSKKGVCFVLQRSEIMKKLKYFDESNTIEDVVVSLSDINFNGPHPLGSISVLSDEHISNNELSRRSVVSRMSNQYASPASISSFQSIRDMLQQIPEKSSSEEDQNEGVITFEVKNVSKVEEDIYSDPIMIRNLSWSINFQPYEGEGNKKKKAVGIFVFCDDVGNATPWSCEAEIEITLKNCKGEDIKREIIKNVFSASTRGSGYDSFVPWADIDSSKGYNNNDSITIEASIQAKVPRGVGWYSKKLTGYVGIKNDEGSSYLNSMLQVLFFTNKFRKVVFNLPTEHDNVNNVALVLQRVFYELQCNEKPVEMNTLTSWKTLSKFMDCNSQKVCREILDNIEEKMEAISAGSIIQEMFEGKMISHICCTDINYTSSREESFYEILLNIKGKTDVLDSLNDYIKDGSLCGGNKYDAGEHGLQDAKKHVGFRKFPSVLHLHLLRTQFDPQTNASYEIKDRYEYPETLDLSDFLEEEAKGVEPAPVYTLQSVLAHVEDGHDGQYVAYINPKGDGEWYKFNDDIVSRALKKEAMENNFGGCEDNIIIRHSSACMLSYIRTSSLKDILCDVTNDDIPCHLEDKCVEERQLETQRRKERNEANIYMDVQVLTADSFCIWSGNDLYDVEHMKPVHFKIQKKEKLKDATKIIAESFGYMASQCRLWPFQKRANMTIRLASVEIPTESGGDFGNLGHIELFDVNSQEPVMLTFLETLDLESGLDSLPDFDRSNEIILCFKYYNPSAKIMSYCGHAYVNIKSQPTSLFPMLCQRAGLPAGTKLSFYEEVRCGQTETIRTDKNFEEVVQDLMDGDIICFQATEIHYEHEFPTPIEYFSDIMQQAQNEEGVSPKRPRLC